MGFQRVAPRIFENSDGYTVQVGSKTTIEYIEGPRRAIVEVEFGLNSTCIYVNRISGWVCGHLRLPMTDDDIRDERWKCLVILGLTSIVSRATRRIRETD
jgi:hypothetical protein